MLMVSYVPAMILARDRPLSQLQAGLARVALVCPPFISLPCMIFVSSFATANAMIPCSSSRRRRQLAHASLPNAKHQTPNAKH
jgi:hypothetical protein